MVTKRATARFIVKEDGEGRPSISVEQLGGDSLHMFEGNRVVLFELRERMTLQQATDLAHYLDDMVVSISETP